MGGDGLPETTAGGAIFQTAFRLRHDSRRAKRLRPGVGRPDADPQRPRASATCRVRDLPGQLLLWVDCDNNHAIDVDKKDHGRFI